MNLRARVCLLITVSLLFTYLACQRAHDPVLDSFQIHPDFEITRVAKEPLVLDPVDMEFNREPEVEELQRVHDQAF